MQSNKYRMRRGTLLAVSMLLFCIFLLSGCGKLPDGMLKQEKELYTQGQIRMIAATERNRYQNLYTGQLWSVTADGQGISDTIKTITDAGFVYEIESD